MWLGKEAAPWTKERAITLHTNWNFWIWSGLLQWCFMNICSATSSWSSQIITTWLTSWQWLNWMQWATTGWLSWPHMISQCCISQGRSTLEADALSRIDWDRELTSEVGSVILNTAMDGCSPLAKICAHTMTVVPSFLLASGNTQLETRGAMPKQMTAADWTEAQMQDQDLNQIICLSKVRQLDIAKIHIFRSREVKALLCHQLKLELWEVVLYFKTFPNWEDVMTWD